MIALFPYKKNIKDNHGEEALNENNLVCRALRYYKKIIKIKLE